MDIEKFSAEIRKTGFVLENRIAIGLKREGWTVISNKYYPNSDWWPLHAWTNEKPLTYELSQPGISRAYHNDVQELGVKDVLSVPDVDVFAFQEMKRSGGAPQNDKHIFNAVTSLMKAQAYELSSLPQRKKSPAVYQFNLLSIIDSDLVRLKFTDDSIRGESIDCEHYIARYIIKKKESFSRVRFIKASFFEDALSDYNRLHAANCLWFDKTTNHFFDEIVKDWNRIRILIDEFRAKLKWSFLYRLERHFKKSYETSNLSLGWRAKDNRLAVTLQADPEVFEFLNNDKESRAVVAAALKEVYRYSGEFFFDEDDIPF
jgi:hypothetical protein